MPLLFSTRNPTAPMLAIFVSCAVMGMTIITPAVPALRLDLGVTYNAAQLTITLYLITLSLGQIFFGSLSDRFGRRPIFIAGGALFLSASLICVNADNITALLIGRGLQGLGAAALLTIGRVMVHDIYPDAKARTVMSTITAMQAVVPVLALATGGLVVDNFGWRGNMIILFLAAAIALGQAVFFTPETNKKPLERLQIADLMKAYSAVFANPNWRYFTICAAVQIAIFYSMNGYMSYHFTRLGLSLSQFGAYYAVISLGYIFGNLTIRRIGHKYSVSFWITLGSYISFIILLTMWTLDATGLLTAALLSGLLFVFGFGNGLVVANAIIGSLKGTGQYSGTANGLGGASHMLLGGLSGSLIISLGGAHSFAVCMIVNLIMATASLMAARAIRGLK